MPKISLKTPEQIAVMAEGGGKLGEVLSEVLGKIKPGLSTLEIDSWIEDRILNFGGQPSFKMVPRYHWASCICLNDEVVHGVPRKDRIISEGDLLKIDLGMLWKGLNTDMSWTVEVQRSKGAGVQRKFLEAGEKALEKAIAAARAGNRVGHISQAIEDTIRGAGYEPVAVLTGHGIGKRLHEEPMVPGVLKARIEETLKLEEGMTLAIEVIYAEKSGEVVLEEDGWTISTKDGKMSGLFEKTIAILENGPLELTQLRGV
jgi:methionyl aminopeptidase